MDISRQASTWRALMSRLVTRHNPAVPGPSLARWPRPRRATLIVSFEGWNDAGEAASLATAFLSQAWDAKPFAEMSPEEYFDFTEVRPEIATGEGGANVVSWPSTVLSIASPGGDGAVIFLRGPEPHLRWRHYCASVIELAKRMGVAQVITLGAYLAEITHDRPVPLSAVSTSPDLLVAHGLATSAYEGPTGIVGVLGLMLGEAGIAVTSLWASVPCYSLPVSPKAAVGLVDVIGRIMGLEVETEELDELAADYEQRMDEMVRDDESIAAYVERIQELEEALGGELSAERLADEAERYLRERRPR